MRAARLAVDAADLLVVERAELDARRRRFSRTTEPSGFERTAIVAELLRGLQPALRADGVGHLLAGRRRAARRSGPTG